MNSLDDNRQRERDMDCSYDISDLSSDLSSAPASPIPPPDFYPSPPPSYSPDDRSLLDLSQECSTTSAPSDPLVPKKRRKPEPKPRTTKHLDLTLSVENSNMDQSLQLDLLLKTLRTKRKIVVVAGAGISVSAGSKSLCRRYPFTLT
jgi:NAD-dependent histone deacetylase SIR2